MDDMFFAVKESEPTVPVTEWVCTKTLEYGGLNPKLLTRADGSESVYVCDPYCYAYGYLFYRSQEDAENARRMAIVKRYGDLKRRRASMARELRQLKEIISSWYTN